MATLEKIRSKGVLLIVVVGFALLAFIVGDFLTQGSTYFSKSREIVASIAGEDINIADFHAAIDQMTEVYKIETGQNELSEDIVAQLRASVWESLVNEKLLNAEAQKMGLSVSKEELSDRLIGNNIHPLILQRRAFADETGRFSRVALLQFYEFANQNGNPEAQQQAAQAKNYWLFWERNVKNSILQEKYTALISKAVVANSVEAQQAFDASKNSLMVQYIVQPYFMIADSLVNVSNNDIKNLYNKRKELFKQEANRSINYVAFTVKPIEEDYKEAEEWINRLSEEFKTTDDVTGLVNSNSDVMYDGRNYTERTVPMALKDFAFGGNNGDYFGPIFSNDTYTMARIMEAGIMQSDSVKLRHIFLTSADESKKDSIIGAIRGGANFGELALKYSAIQQTAVNGGEIGWVQDGAGVDKDLAEAFNKNTNEIFTISNPSGVQIIQIMEKTPARRKVKLAILQRQVIASSRTQSKLFNEAKQFAGSVSNIEKFTAKAEENGYIIRPAVELTAMTDRIADIPQSREVIRWTFQNSKGDVSDVIECGNTFIVAAINEVNEKGYRSIEKATPQLKAELLRDKKAELISKKMADQLASSSSLESLAAALNVDVKEAENVTFAGYQFGAAGFEPAVIGKTVNQPMNKISTPIKGNAGVYVVMPVDKTVNEMAYDAKLQKAQLNAQSNYTLPYSILQDLKDKAKITDNRLNFY